MRHTVSSFRALLQALFCCCLLYPAAAIANVPASNFIDNGRTTFDKTTGLEWLDLTETAGIPYLDVNARLAQGGEFAEFRHATEQEVQNIFSVFNFVESPVNESHILFTSLFGITSPRGGTYGDSYGYVDPGDDAPRVPGKDYPIVPVYGLNNLNYEGDEIYMVYRGELSHNPSLSYNGFGSYMVKEHGRYAPVPEIDVGSTPLALAVLLFGCLVHREKRRRKIAD